MKYNHRSPYRNVSNDFNYFKFILEVLKQRERISYEQFIISTFSNDGNVKDFLKIIDKNSFGELSEVETFLRAKYGTNLKTQTILRDYPDVVLRLLVITGFVSIQFRGKVFIYRNIANDDYINDLLSVNVELTDKEKEIPSSYFTKLETYNNQLLKIVSEHREKVVEKDGVEYVQKVSEIIKMYELDEEKIAESIIKYGFEFLEHGKKHDAYINRETGKIIRIERHWNQEVRSGLMNKLKKDIGF